MSGSLAGHVRVVVNDFQVPFHDVTAFRLLLKALRMLKPNGLDILGDFMDFYSISDFSKDPERKLLLRDELKVGRRMLAELVRAAGGRRRRLDCRFSDGNHEDRLRRYVWKNAPRLAGIEGLNVPDLLNLKALGIRHYSYLQPYKIGQLWFHHGKLVRKHAGMTALAHIQTVGGNVIVGHCHRTAHICKTTWSHTLQGWENGCMCRLDPEYIHGRPDWQQGFAIIRYGRGRTFGVEQIPIRRGRMWIDGREYGL